MMLIPDADEVNITDLNILYDGLKLKWSYVALVSPSQFMCEVIF